MIGEMKTKIYELVGTASMCWDETPHGVFDSTQAIKVAEQILSICQEAVAEACRQQREICAKAYLRERGYNETANSIISTVIRNAPSPLNEVR